MVPGRGFGCGADRQLRVCLLGIGWLVGGVDGGNCPLGEIDYFWSRVMSREEQ